MKVIDKFTQMKDCRATFLFKHWMSLSQSILHYCKNFCFVCKLKTNKQRVSLLLNVALNVLQQWSFTAWQVWICNLIMPLTSLSPPPLTPAPRYIEACLWFNRWSAFVFGFTEQVLCMLVFTVPHTAFCSRDATAANYLWRKFCCFLSRWGSWRILDRCPHAYQKSVAAHSVHSASAVTVRVPQKYTRSLFHT